ncbi:MAG: shikimate kinase [Gemmataceae bacterium]|nr:shikimate kinase [Gemmataceae bacterium]
MAATQRIFLVGYRGAGKTATAALLAQRLGWDWCDADAVLEHRFGSTIRDIFLREGEAGFRDKETAVLRDLVQRPRCVIATGGGVVLRPENRSLLRSGTVVWLTAAPTTLWQRIQGDAATAAQRPNLNQGGLAEVEEQLERRRPLYQSCADVTIDTSAQPPADVAAAIVAELRDRGWPVE